MVDPRFLEAWFRLAAEAARGSDAARRAIRAGETPGVPAELATEMAKLMPDMGFSSTALNEWLEEWWRLLGVVPRSRYLELLDRYETLRVRLEEAEATVRKLRSMLPAQGAQVEATRLLDAWASTVERTLEAQSAWIRSWTGGSPGTSRESGETRRSSSSEGAAEKSTEQTSTEDEKSREHESNKESRQ